MLLRCLLALLIAISTLSAAEPKTPHLVYRVRVDADLAGGFHFELEITNPPQKELALGIPFWAPGAYREITVGVRSGPSAALGMIGWSAVDGTGAAREVRQDGPRRWLVDARGAERITIRWSNSTPGDRLNNRSYLVRNSGLLDGPRNWAYVEGLERLPLHVRFDLPQGWRIASGLDPTFDPAVFTAKDYDRLADSPTLLGLFDEWRFEVRGVPHRIVAATAGREPRFDADALVDMARRIVEATVSIFEDVPYEHYTFLYTGGGGGGLEHLNSTTISTSDATAIRPRFVQGVTAHEFFHTWNVKRLRPFALGPFDYTRPVPVKDLWICEGLTSYYTNIILWRAGIFDDAGFRAAKANAIGAYLADEKSWYESSERSSEQVWAGGPLRYYNTGEVLGLALDLHIRDASDNEWCLDDLFREMYRRYGGYYRHQAPKPGFQSEDWVAVLKEISGLNVEPFFDAHIRASEPVDWNRWLGVAGFEMAFEVRPSGSIRGLEVYEVEENELFLRVESGSAADSLGLRNGDRLFQIDGEGMRSPRTAMRRIQRAAAGQEVKLRLERAGQALELTLAVPPRLEWDALEFAAGEEAPILSIVPNDTAYWAAGLRAADRILSIDGTDAPTLAAVLQKLSTAPAGAEQEIRYARGESAPKLARVQVRALVRPNAGPIRRIDQPTPRQEAIFQGLKAGSSVRFQSAQDGR